MANSERRAEYTDKYGNMFMPMNVEGGVWSNNFMTTPKIITLVGIFSFLLVIIFYLGSISASINAYLICIGVWLIVSIYLVRYIVFEEKFYYRMYTELDKNEITTPATFWDIASIKDIDDSAIMTYSDAKIGVIVKLERDTITGKEDNFKETHFDAVSDFYRSLANNKLSYITMNIMEGAGSDPRLVEMSKLVYKSDNPNICKLMEMEVGYIKNITKKSLYENEYILIYTSDLSKLDNFISDVSDCLFKLLDGAYVNYKILTSKELGSFAKEDYKVNHFNYTEASLNMFKNNIGASIEPFKITGILWDNGEMQELNNREILKLKDTTSKVINETIKIQDISLKDTLYREDNKNKIGIDFNNLSKERKVESESMELEKRKVTVNKNTKGTVEINGEEYIDL